MTLRESGICGNAQGYGGSVTSPGLGSKGRKRLARYLVPAKVIVNFGRREQVMHGVAWCLGAEGGLNTGSKPFQNNGVRCREGREEAIWLGGDKDKSLFRTRAAMAQKPQQKAFGRAQGVFVLIQMHPYSFPILTSTTPTQPW